MKQTPKQTLSYARATKQGKDADFIRNQIGAAISSAIFVAKAFFKFLYEISFFWRP